MIICLSGFVIAGTSPAPPAARTDAGAAERVGVGVGAGACGARYSPHHHQLLQQFAAPPARGAARSSSSSTESVSSHSASPPPPHRRVRTLYACLGEGEGELSFEPNQIITNVAPSGEPGWLRGTLNGRSGLVPENYVEPLP